MSHFAQKATKVAKMQQKFKHLTDFPQTLNRSTIQTIQNKRILRETLN